MDVGSSSLAISQSVIAFTAFLPNFLEVGKSDPESVRGQVRLGETAAIVVSLSIGSLLSWVSGSYIPVVIAGLMSLVLAGMYEHAMRQEVC
jgi:hypothetical protein